MDARSKVKVGIVLADGAVAPEYMSDGAAGADLRSTEKVNLEPGERASVGTGIQLEIPDGYEAQVRPRSGLAIKHGVTMINSPGTIDSDFRGEVRVLIVNLGQENFVINPGDRIAQIVIAPVVRVHFEPREAISGTTRDVGGFGSTGKS